jgi:hypothetical protein
MTRSDTVEGYLTPLTPELRAIATRVIETVSTRARFDVAVKWRQLTFALDDDFDHWICAVAAGKKQVQLKFHFGSMLDDIDDTFSPADGKYVRKIVYATGDEVDDAVIGRLVDDAVAKVDDFKRHWRGQRS